MKFVGKISKEGDKRRMVIIPRRLHEQIELLEGLDLLITLKPIVVDSEDDETLTGMIKKKLKQAALAAADWSTDEKEIELMQNVMLGILHPVIDRDDNGKKRIKYIKTEAAPEGAASIVEKKCRICGKKTAVVNYCGDCFIG